MLYSKQITLIWWRKVQQDLWAFFLLTMKISNEYKHLNPSSNPVMILLHSHRCQRKKQSYNQLSNISFSPFYTVSENNQSGTVKLFDCDLSSALNQTFGPTQVGGCPLFVVEAIYNQRSFFIYLQDILVRGLRIFTNVWFCGVCDFYAISWASSNIVIHITIWIDFIYDRRAKSSTEKDFFIPVKTMFEKRC